MTANRSTQKNNALWHLGIVGVGILVSYALGLSANKAVNLAIHDFALHALLETLGSAFSLLLAFFIFRFDNQAYRLTRLHYVALALIGMAVLNLIHAMDDSEAFFIWPHTVSTLVGAFLLLGVFLSTKTVSKRLYYGLPITIAALSLFIGVCLIINSQDLPPVLYQNQFSPIILNTYHLSSLLYVTTATYFALFYWQYQQQQDLYLFGTILLLATVSFLFANNALWGMGWWYWHLIKLIAYLLVFFYFLGVIQRKNQEYLSREIESNLIKYSVDAIITKSPDGTVLTWNASAEKLFGYRAEEIIGQKISLLYQPAWELQESEITLRILEGMAFKQLETAFIAKDNSLIDVAVTLSPIKDSQGKIIGISKIVRDMRDKKQIETKIQALNSELEHKVAERTLQLQNAYDEMEAFTYSVSHDLRSPLRATDGFSQALLEDYGDQLDTTAKDYLNRIRAASQKMAGLIDDLLQLSRQTRTEMNPEPINLSKMAEEIIADLKQQEPNREVDVIIAPNLTAHADAHLLRIALVNLLSNAWKYTSHKSIARIEFNVKKENNENVFFIRDNGAGFDMAYSDKLFKPFQRLHSAQEFSGNGIGLAMVYRIIKRHLGRVWADATPEVGATFFFTIALSKTT